MINEHTLVSIYQKLVEEDFKKSTGQENSKQQGYPRHGIIQPDAPIKGFTPEELEEITSEFTGKKEGSLYIEKLVSEGYLVKTAWNSNLYRTIHMDVAIKSAFLRTYYKTDPYIISPRIAIYKLPIATKADRKLNMDYCSKNPKIKPTCKFWQALVKQLKSFFDDNEEALNIYLEFLDKYFGKGGLDPFQAHALALLLNRDGLTLPHRSTIILAPTGFGKTEIFTLYMIAKILKNKMKTKETNENAVLVYPRKALAIDQTSRLIKMLLILNDILTKKNRPKITLGLRDGSTPRSLYEVQKILHEKGNSFRGIVIDGIPLEYEITNGKVLVQMKDKTLDFIIPTKIDMYNRRPDILITNMWALEWRLLDSISAKDISSEYFQYTSTLIIDEVHEYHGISAGFINILINLIRKINETGQLDIIFSTATLPKPEKFIEKISDMKPLKIDFKKFIDDYSKMDSNSNIYQGSRLVIIGIYDIKPTVSWSTYTQLWAIMTSFINFSNRWQNKKFAPKSLIFIQNISEIRSVISGILENINLGEPRDHLVYQLYDIGSPSLCAYSFLNYVDSNAYEQYIKTKMNDKFTELLEMVTEMHSELEDKDKKEVIRDLKDNQDYRYSTIITTSSLELGVDYGSVSFILNGGFDNPISLSQRIGRAGRSIDSLYTSLGIIVTKKVPTESFYLHDPNIWDLLNPFYIERDKPLPVTRDIPRIKERYILEKAILSLALKGISTYNSGRNLIRNTDMLTKFINKILKEV